MYLVYEIDEANVKWLVAEVLANNLEDRSFRNVRIIYGQK